LADPTVSDSLPDLSDDILWDWHLCLAPPKCGRDGVEQIAVATQNINQASAQNLSSTRQTEKAARELDVLARRLSEVVEQFSL
jgi:hypothetical protein